MQYPTENRDPRRGNTYIESSLVLGLFLALFVGAFELGRVVWSYNTLSHAVRQAGRYAAVRGDLGDPNTPNTANGDHPIDAVLKANAVGLDPSMLTIRKTWSPDKSRGSTVVIEVEYPLGLVASPLFLGRSTVTVAASSSMTILN